MSLLGFKKCAACIAMVVSLTAGATAPAFAAGDGHGSALSDEAKPLIKESELPTRTQPIIELGPSFLGTGNIDPGIELPTGAVWQPALWLIGSSRTGVQYFDGGNGPEYQEAVARVDLQFNLQFTPTERIVYAVSPLRKGTAFTGYNRKPKSGDGFNSELNWDTTALYFEGEFGEIFPRLDPEDRKSYDFGFSVGRQPLFFQEGIMINDTLDSVGITRDTIVIPGITPDMRATLLYAWNNVHRDDNRELPNTQLLGLFTETDLRFATVQFDMAYVLGNGTSTGKAGDGFYWGAAAIQRLGKLNLAYRVNQSYAVDKENAAVSDGTLLYLETSYTPAYTDNVVYVNAFWGIDNYSSAARDPTAGGPLGRAGQLFSSTNLGNFGAALSNRADDVAGGAAGYQMFFNNYRTQVVFELGGRYDTSGNDKHAVGAGVRLQQAVGDRVVWQSDGFVTHNYNANDGAGVRTELLVRF